MKTHNRKMLTRLGQASVALMMLTYLTASPSAAGSAADPVAFVKVAAQNAISILNDTQLAAPDRKNRFRELILKNFDSAAVGQYVLGSYWAKANPDQQGRFQSVFKEALAQIYIERFFEYDGRSLQVFGSKDGQGGATVVQTTVNTAAGDITYNVDWIVLNAPVHLSLIDVIIDGVSTMSTTKQDYASVLRANNGDLDGLTTRLAEKVR